MSKTINDGGPAFPCNWMDFQPDTGDQVVREQFYGLSIRDWFAGMAMNAIGSNPYTAENLVTNVQPQDTEAVVARMAYKMADAMLAAREP